MISLGRSLRFKVHAAPAIARKMILEEFYELFCNVTVLQHYFIAVAILFMKCPMRPISAPSMASRSALGCGKFLAVAMEDRMPPAFVAVQVAVLNMAEGEVRKNIRCLPVERPIPARCRGQRVVALSGALGVVDGAPEHFHRAILEYIWGRVHIIAVTRIRAVFLTPGHFFTRTYHMRSPWTRRRSGS